VGYRHWHPNSREIGGNDDSFDRTMNFQGWMTRDAVGVFTLGFAAFVPGEGGLIGDGSDRTA
jgi:hypothetical protein